MGAYCPQGSSMPALCPAGRFNPNNTRTSFADCLVCPGGAWCPLAAPNATLCVAGSYNPETMRTNITACFLCPGGAFGSTSGLSSDTCSGQCQQGQLLPSRISVHDWNYHFSLGCR